MTSHYADKGAQRILELRAAFAGSSPTRTLGEERCMERGIELWWEEKEAAGWRDSHADQGQQPSP